MSEHLGRRDFLKTAALAGVGLTLESGCAPGMVRPATPASAGTPLAVRPLDTVRMGFVGVGHQGTSHVGNFLKIPGVEIRAICDVDGGRAARAQRLVVDAGQPEPRLYTRGPVDYQRMIDQEEIDLVFNATHWDLHAPVLLYGMRSGKHVATEVPFAVTLDECWELVETAEATRRHCVMMENCCYDRTEMMILNMVRNGLFGELLHAEGGYLHDLRELKLTDFYYDRWRVKHSIARNGDLYPTHGIGPIAQWLDINRGNQFEYLVSVGSPSRGLNLWAAEHIGTESPEAKQKYALSDVVDTLIRTRNGPTILLTHDTNLPRPYSRRIVLQGTRGLVRKYPDEKIHIEGRSPAHRWEATPEYLKAYEHPIWKELEEQSRGAGHGGMDYIEDFRLIRALQGGLPTDLDVYDGAACTAIIMLSERSITARSAPQEFPDFTRGAWQLRAPLDLGESRVG
jgi:predicted dehydrogenase